MLSISDFKFFVKFCNFVKLKQVRKESLFKIPKFAPKKPFAITYSNNYYLYTLRIEISTLGIVISTRKIVISTRRCVF